jgi:3-phosphoshikimate 1-carboxyvinyltransferase
LGTLTIKETNRIEALKIELEKLGAKVEVTSNTLTIKKGIKASSKVFTVDTYKDHRMAMAFAPLKLVLPNLIINSPEVVQKSYPNFWRDLAILGIDFD